jgi:hypothetical protein
MVKCDEIDHLDLIGIWEPNNGHLDCLRSFMLGLWIKVQTSSLNMGYVQDVQENIIKQPPCCRNCDT